MIAPNKFAQAGSYISSMYRSLETILIKDVNKIISMGGDGSDWRSRLLKETKNAQVRLNNNLRMARAASSVDKQRLIMQGYISGVHSSQSDLYSMGMIGRPEPISDEAWYGMRSGIGGQFGAIHESAVTAITAEYMEQDKIFNSQILTTYSKAIRQANYEAVNLAVMGYETRKQASRTFMNKIDKSFRFVDKSGRHWDTGAYSEMLIRTSTANAQLAGHMNASTEHGQDLMIVSAHGMTCERCMPWERVVLSISGNNSKYPSYGHAKASGLFHPNCGHSMAVYIDGVTSTQAPSEEDKAEGAAQYKESQRQRRSEAKVREWKRKEQFATTEDELKQARGKVKEWQKNLRKQTKESGLPRKIGREQINHKGTDGKSYFYGSDGVKREFKRIPKISKPTAPAPPPPPPVSPLTPTAPGSVGRAVFQTETGPVPVSSPLFDLDGLNPNLQQKSTNLHQGYVGTRLPNRYPQSINGVDDLAEASNSYHQILMNGSDFSPTIEFVPRLVDWKYGKNVTGVNRASAQIIVSPRVTTQLAEIGQSINKKVAASEMDINDLINNYQGMRTLVHESFHSYVPNNQALYDNLLRHTKSQKYAEYYRIKEEGLTEWLARAYTRDFMRYVGTPSPPFTAMNAGNYAQETARFQILAGYIREKTDLSIFEIRAAYTNLKLNTMLDDDKLIQFTQGLIGSNKKITQEAVEEFGEHFGDGRMYDALRIIDPALEETTDMFRNILLQRWRDAGEFKDDIVVLAVKKWDDVAGQLTITNNGQAVQSVFKVVSKDLRNEAVQKSRDLGATAVKKTMKLSELSTAQAKNSTEALQEMLKALNTPEKIKAVNAPIRVIRYNGENILTDGNHRATLLKSMGEKNVQVEFIDLDKLLKQ